MSNATNKTASSTHLLDRFGMVGSSLCVIHCLVCAFLPGLLAIFGLNILLNSTAEWGFTIFTIAVAILALWSGFKQHRSTTVVLLFMIGITGLLTSRVIEESSGHHAHAAHHEEHADEVAAHHEEEGAWDPHVWGAVIGILSGFPIIAGHFLSIKKSRCCEEKSCSITQADQVPG